MIPHSRISHTYRQPRSDSAELARAARHLIQSHGSRAATIAVERAAHLDQFGEDVGADTWRKIASLVRAIEAGEFRRPRKTGDAGAKEAVER